MPRGDRRYRIRGLGKNLSPEVMKVNVLVSRQDEFHVDTLDLQTDRQRAAFIKRAAEELGLKEDVIRKDRGPGVSDARTTAGRADPQSARSRETGSPDQRRRAR